MTSYKLRRTALPDVVFEGELLTEQIGSDCDGATEGRVHDIRVYEADDGQYLVSVDYRSPLSTELSDHFVEAVDDLAGVDDILSLYNPVELLDQSLFVQDGSAQGGIVSRTLLDRFDRQVIATLDSLNVMKVS